MRQDGRGARADKSARLGVMVPEGADGKLRPGAFVGEYQIGHLLGAGGMGVVYAGTHPEIGKRVAIKVLGPHAAQHPDLIRRFKEEARAVNKIRHPNIIDIFAFNQLPDGRHYFVMEYLEGESLTARLERGEMEFSEMRRLLGQICSALEAAHEEGVIHRDLKPDNIWVATQHRSESRIKLLDFGIAKLSDHPPNVKTTQAGVSLGTPHYMPPEQGLGRPVDHRADIYALGVVLYQIFAGALPFDGATTHEIVLKHVTEAPRRPSSHRPIAPAAMERIILDCLEKSPERRPQSVRALSERIEAAFAGGSDSRAQPGGTAVIPRLPTVPAAAPGSGPSSPGRTEKLPEEGAVARTAALHSAPATTLRGATGERATPDYDPGAGNLAASGRHGWRRPVVGIAVVALVAIGLGVARWGRPTSEATLSPATPAGAATAAPAASPASAATTASAAAALPPLPAEKPTTAATAPADAPTASVTAPPIVAPQKISPPVRSRRHEHQQVVGAKTPPERKHPAAAEPHGVTKPATVKPNCNPNFYIDAEGDKHFKPECF
jgi:serine/threonine-protein kinase